jgi:hypothetical protein
MAGDTVRTETLAGDLGKRFPLDTQMQSLWLGAIQAQLAVVGVISYIFMVRERYAPRRESP